MRRAGIPALLLIALSACNAPIDPIASISLSLTATSASVATGAAVEVPFRVTRTNGYTGAVSFSLENVPAGVTVSISNEATDGAVTTAVLSIQVGANAVLGPHPFRIRGRASGIPETTALFTLTVIEPSNYVLSVAPPSMTLLQGGSAPVSVSLNRTNFPGEVTLALTGAPGITAAFASNPVTASLVEMTLSVAPSVSVGVYQMSVVGTAPGQTNRTAPLSVTVSAAAIGLAIAPVVVSGQGGTVATPVTINRNGYGGAVDLSIDNLPAGVTASFAPSSTTTTSSTLTLVVGPQAGTGTSTVTVRGTGSGAGEATTTFQLTVNAAVIGLTPVPNWSSVLQGTSATSSLRITRQNFDGGIAISAEGAPTGLTVTSSPAIVTNDVAALTVSASPAVPAGEYTVTLRATPVTGTARVSPSAALQDVTVPIVVTVSPPSSGTGNVVLTWTGCPQPDWVARQDGAGPWVQVLPVGGSYHFTIGSSRGGYAYAGGGNSVIVRYLAQSELTGQPVEHCAPSPGPLKTIVGNAVHRGPSEVFTWLLGGVSTLSTQVTADFSLIGVPPGVHDLLGWGTSASLGLRALLRRDVDLPGGGSLGAVDLTGTESFAPAGASLSSGNFGANESYTHTMRYLTTAACTVNTLYTRTFFTLNGIPSGMQRPDDYHMVTLFANSITGMSRQVTDVFHTLANRSMPFPAQLNPPVITPLLGSFVRFELSFPSIPGVYNGFITFDYGTAASTTRLSASNGYTGFTSVVLSVPEFSGVSGWPGGSALPPGTTGSWSLALTSAEPGTPLCTENRRMLAATRVGTF